MKVTKEKPILFYLIISILMMEAFIIRLMAIMGNLSLDEIWSLNLVTNQINSFHEILTKLHLDNNHILNSFFMYLMGSQVDGVWYRIPALIGGMGALYFAYLISLKFGKAQALFTTIFIGFSYPFIFYSSEARGYGLVIGIVAASFFVAYRILEENQWNQKWITTLWVLIVLGFLAHLTFIHFYLGLILWSCFKIFTKNENLKNKVKNISQLHWFPLIFLIWFYWIFISHIVNTGGIERALIPALHETFAYTFGFLLKEYYAPLIIIGCALVGLISLFLLGREKQSFKIFYLTSIVISPTLLLIIYSNIKTLNNVRFFLISDLLYIVLISNFFAWLWRKKRIGQFLCICMMMIFVCGQFHYVTRFIKYGRGRYIKTLEYIVKHSNGEKVTVGSDHDFRNGTVILYYKPRIKNGHLIRYINKEEWKGSVPRFYLEHVIGQFKTRTTYLQDTYGNRYKPLKVFPNDGGLSGWHWYLYERLSSQ